MAGWLQTMAALCTLAHVCLILILAIRPDLLKPSRSFTGRGFRRSRIDKLRMSEMRYHLLGATMFTGIFFLYHWIPGDPSPPGPLSTRTTFVLVIAVFVVLFFRLASRMPLRRLLPRRLSWALPPGIGHYPVDCVLLSYVAVTLMVMTTGMLHSPFMVLLVTTVYASQFVVEKGDQRYAVTGTIVFFGLIFVLALQQHINLATDDATMRLFPWLKRVMLGGLVTAIGTSIFYALGRNARDLLVAPYTDDYRTTVDLNPVIAAFGGGLKEGRKEREFAQVYEDIVRRKGLFRADDEVLYDDAARLATVTMLHALPKGEAARERDTEMHLEVMHRLWGIAACKADGHDAAVRTKHVDLIGQWLVEHKFVKSFARLNSPAFAEAFGREAYAINFDPSEPDWVNEYGESHLVLLPYCLASATCPSFPDPVVPFQCPSSCRHECKVHAVLEALTASPNNVLVVTEDTEVVDSLREFMNGGGKYVYFMCCPMNLFKACRILEKCNDLRFVFHPLTLGFDLCDYARSKTNDSRDLCDVDVNAMFQ